MKKILFLLTLLIAVAPLYSIAQEENNTEVLPSVKENEKLYYPGSGDFGITANLTGLINNINATPRADLIGAPSLLFRYTQSDRFTFRLGIAPQVSRFSQISTDSVGNFLVEFDSSSTRSNISFRPGVEFHLEGTKRLDPYIAVDAELGLVGRLNINSLSNIQDTTGTSRITRTITQDGGFAVGGKLSVGMNYFVAKKLFFGLEYGMGISSVISGGDRQEVVQIEPVSGTNTTLRDLSSVRTTDLNFFVDPMVQITVGYFFGF